MSVIKRLFGAVCVHDPSFAAAHSLSGEPGKVLIYEADPETEAMLRRKLCFVIRTKFNPAAFFSAEGHPVSKGSIQTTLFKTKLALKAAAAPSFSIHSLRHKSVADRIERRAIARNQVAETIRWLSHILLCLDPDTPDPASTCFSEYLDLIYIKALTMGSSPYNPLKVSEY
jgi:hypothetical protein